MNSHEKCFESTLIHYQQRIRKSGRDFYWFRPNKPKWAKGELPWFGLIKLRVTQPDNYYDAPPECRTMLWISMFVVLAGPVLAGKLWDTYQTRNSLDSKPKSDKKREE